MRKAGPLRRFFRIAALPAFLAASVLAATPERPRNFRFTGAGAPPPATPCVADSGADYRVGPGQTYGEVTQVPWDSLGAGDTVRIFWRPAHYKGKVLVHGSGTAAHPIRVCGVADPASGAKPVLDGSGAVSRAGQPYRGTGQGPGVDMENYAELLIDGTDWVSRPEYIVIDGLDLRGANVTAGNGFTSTGGQARTYVQGAACIRVQMGQHLVFRGNEISDCDNGIFTQSAEYWDPTNGVHEETLTRDILIEGNDIHGNGVVASDTEHDTYIQSFGVVYQFNRYGPLRPGALGSAFTDRSVGDVIRFNRIDGGARALDLVEAENTPHAALADPRYRETFVYGNVITHVAAQGVAIHYGGDHYGYNVDLTGVPDAQWPSDAYGEFSFRKGTLYFFNNTLVLDASGQYGTSFFQLSTTQEHAEVFNNVFWMTGNPYFVGFRSDTRNIAPLYTVGGTFHAGVNVINAGWQWNPDDGHVLPPGYVSGDANMLTTTAAPFDPVTYKPLPGSPGIDKSQPLSSFPSLSAIPDDKEFTDDLKGCARPLLGIGADLGALEGD